MLDIDLLLNYITIVILSKENIMRQYRVSIIGAFLIGITVEYDPNYSITIRLPFILIIIGLTSSASGINIFNKFIL